MLAEYNVSILNICIAFVLLLEQFNLIVWALRIQILKNISPIHNMVHDIDLNEAKFL